MNTTNNSIIEFHNVSKSFGSLSVLTGVNLQIHRGETTVILGESGTGKSVLLKHIVGLLRPDSGQVLFDGNDLTKMSERKLAKIRTKFGFLFQGGAFFNSMTAIENVAFPLVEHSGLDKAAIEERAFDKLKMVGLEKFAGRMPGQLSGGQKKRVALARAVALDPQIILYDEPTTGLDPVRADVIDELILKLKEELHVTSIVVTHDMKSAFKVADRVLMLYHGNFIFDGTPQQLRDSQDLRIHRFIAGEADPKELEALDVS